MTPETSPIGQVERPSISCPLIFLTVRTPVNRAHTAHAHLWGLAKVNQRDQYEELRAAYNGVRFAGSSPAPPFEEWRGMSDLCDHPYCR